jgi:hypothetical protein
MKSLILVFLCVSALSFADAKVLPAGTTIIMPDGTTKTVLSDSCFLLTRADMEKAVKALDDMAIDEKVIGDLRTLSDGQQRTIDTATTWKRIDAVLGFLLGIAADEGGRKLVGK